MATQKTKKMYAIPITENQVFYTTVKRPNPKDRTKAPLYYAQVHHMARAGISTLQDRLVQMSALSRGDVLSVLSNLIEVIKEHLRNGRIVELGDLGSLYLGISSKGLEKEKDFTSAQIKSARILFRAGKDLKSVVSTLNFQKLSDTVVTTDTKTDTKSGGSTSGGTDTGGTEEKPRDGGGV